MMYMNAAASAGTLAAHKIILKIKFKKMDKFVTLFQEAKWFLLALAVLILSITVYKGVDKAQNADEVTKVVTSFKGAGTPLVEAIKEVKDNKATK